jgi:upstream activation factor subunit UAF30
MPKSKKSSKKSSKTKAVAAVPVVAVVAAPVAAAPVAAAPVAAAPVVAATESLATPTLADDFSQLLSELSSLRSALSSVTSQVRALQKKSEREVKAALKASKKRKSKSGNRKPSGFVKPTAISKELATFLGKDAGVEMARTQVTREINIYIRAHKLQDPQNGRIIRADKRLSKLLKLKKDDELTYFNLQRFMSPHFAKNTKVVAKTSA